MAEIAVELERTRTRRDHATEPLSGRLLARGEAWSVEDVICTAGPRDRPFEERHGSVSIAIVLAGTFQYRAGNRPTGELMTPGSLMLGNAGQNFECGHEHAAGDRCLSFHYRPDYFEEIAAAAGVPSGERRFRALRLPALRDASTAIARAVARLPVHSRPERPSPPEIEWNEPGIEIAAAAIRLASGAPSSEPADSPSTIARITRAIRRMEDRLDTNPDSRLTLDHLAQEASLSPYHFLRTFEQVTGVTPHQYVRRLRLRRAAARLGAMGAKVLDVALDCGFGDVSNFNRSFRTEFGMSPLAFRKAALRSKSSSAR